MITIILAVLLIAVWCAGAMIVTVITDWEIGKVKDLLKIVFWPITIFACHS